jgi:hypothetical protein
MQRLARIAVQVEFQGVGYGIFALVSVVLVVGLVDSGKYTGGEG